jgi:DNA (cytosine-5)-methyltransferase 1
VKVAGLFAGIGGIELGFSAAGFEPAMFCEVDPSACAVLETRFQGVPIAKDIRKLRSLPKDVDVVTAGFPCQDLSQAGRTEGIAGERSGLVRDVFRLLERRRVPWVVIENVSFMLRLGRGSAMRYIVDQFERLGYRWAYRVVDSRAFGLPQRRERVFLVASLERDPAEFLFASDAKPNEPTSHVGYACGFYWTEGLRGLGWGIDCVPTLKGGSAIGIPSPPAIWMPNGSIVTPHLCDAERLQGFEAGWTEPAEAVAKRGSRWKLVGNAVSVGAAAWIAETIRSSPNSLPQATHLSLKSPWPDAAFGTLDGRFAVSVSRWPASRARPSLQQFLQFEATPLSARATRGFYSRLRQGGLRRPADFDRALEAHLERLEQYPMAPQRLPGIGIAEAA